MERINNVNRNFFIRLINTTNKWKLERKELKRIKM